MAYRKKKISLKRRSVKRKPMSGSRKKSVRKQSRSGKSRSRRLPRKKSRSRSRRSRSRRSRSRKPQRKQSRSRSRRLPRKKSRSRKTRNPRKIRNPRVKWGMSTTTNLEIENSTPSNPLTTDLTIKKSTTLSTPLTIYTSPGCSACADVKKLCIRKGIKFEAFDRKDHAEYVNKNTGNCKFVPNVFNSNEEYIGGNDDLIKLTKNMKDIQI